MIKVSNLDLKVDTTYSLHHYTNCSYVKWAVRWLSHRLCKMFSITHPFNCVFVSLFFRVCVCVCVFGLGPVNLWQTHNPASSACWMRWDCAALKPVHSERYYSFSLSVCVHRHFMLFVYLQYPGELYIAPNRVCNLIRIVFRSHSTLCVAVNGKWNIS